MKYFIYAMMVVMAMGGLSARAEAWNSDEVWSPSTGTTTFNNFMQYESDRMQYEQDKIHQEYELNRLEQRINTLEQPSYDFGIKCTYCLD